MKANIQLRLVDAFNGAETAADRLAACRAIEDSPEAIAFVRQLEADKVRLMTLPRIKAPALIAANISQAIQPPVILVRSPSRKVTSWQSYVLAASILIAVGIGAFLIANSGSTNDKQLVRKPSAPLSTVPKNDRVIEAPSNSMASTVREELPMPGVGAKTLTTAAASPESNPERIDEKNWLGARVIPELPPLDTVTPRLPYLIPMAEWLSEDVRLRLRQELTKAPAHRLDLFTRDVPRTVEVFSNAMKGQGIALTTVSLTGEQLKRKVPATYVMYCESLTADDWLAFFSKWKPEESTTGAHLIAAGSNESRELKSLLGIDPGLAKRPKEESIRSVSEQTVDQITRTLQKNKIAILTTAGPMASRVNPTAAPEIRSFMDRRIERSAKAVPMMIVIRSAN